MNTYTITDTAGTTARRITAHDATGAARVVLGDIEATPVLVKVGTDRYRLQGTDLIIARTPADTTTTYRVTRRVRNWTATVVTATSPREAWSLVTGSTAGVTFVREGSGTTVRTISGVIGRILA